MEEEKKEPKLITLVLIQETAKGKDGNDVMDPQGEKQYKRDDHMGLIGIIGRFDSTKHPLKDYKRLIRIKDLLIESWSKETKELGLTLEQATFLKEYLVNFPEKEGKVAPLKEFEMRTLVGILEQLE